MDRKYAWLRARANTGSCAKAFQLYCRIADNEMASIRESLPRWMVDGTDVGADTFRRWFERANSDGPDNRESLGFTGSFGQFVSLDFDTWLSHYREDLRACVTQADLEHQLAEVLDWAKQRLGEGRTETSPGDTKTRRAQAGSTGGKGLASRPHNQLFIKIDPSHISHNPEGDWSQSGIVDQKYMYISPFSTEAWATYARNSTWGSSAFLCHHATGQTAEIVGDLDFDDVFFLGAGAPEKEVDFLCELRKRNPNKRYKVIYIDTSIFMLALSANEINDSPLSIDDNFDFELLCFDFTDRKQWADNIGAEVKKPKVALLLGQTIGNIREQHFLDVLRHLFHDGDIFVVGADFYDSREQLTGAGESLKKRYNSEEAKNLVLSSIDHLLSRAGVSSSYRDRLDFIEAQWIEDAEELEADMRSNVPETAAIWYESNQAIVLPHPGKRFPVLKLSVSRRYVKDQFCRVLQRRGFELLGCKRPDENHTYRHLIFRKKAPKPAGPASSSSSGSS